LKRVTHRPQVNWVQTEHRATAAADLLATVFGLTYFFDPSLHLLAAIGMPDINAPWTKVHIVLDTVQDHLVDALYSD
jgi:hypothetical protein